MASEGKADKTPHSNRDKYSVTPVGDTLKKRSIDDAVGYSKTIKEDPSDGESRGMEMPYLKMEEGNILEAKGRDVSDEAVDVSGWGNDDLPYVGMEMQGAPYGMGAGMPGAKSSKQGRK